MSHAAPLVFGRFELRPAERQLLLDGEALPVGARAYDVLALVERRERVVTKRELLDLVWPDTVVEENNVALQVSALHKLLGPGAVATIPGRGYRFTAPGAAPAYAADAAPSSRADSASPGRAAAATPRTNLPAPTPLFGCALGSSQSIQTEHDDAERAYRQRRRLGSDARIVAEARNLAEDVDVPQVGGEREVQPAGERAIVPQERKLGRRAAQPRVIGGQHSCQSSQVCAIARIAEIEIDGGAGGAAQHHRHATDHDERNAAGAQAPRAGASRRSDPQCSWPGLCAAGPPLRSTGRCDPAAPTLIHAGCFMRFPGSGAPPP